MAQSETQTRLFKHLSDKIVEARALKALTQGQLANKAGIHRVTLSNLERGTGGELGVSKIEAILHELGLKLEIVPR